MASTRRPRDIIPKQHVTLSLSRLCCDKITNLRMRGINVSEQVEGFIMAYQGLSEEKVAKQELEAEILTAQAKLFELETLRKARELQEAKKDAEEKDGWKDEI